MTNINLIAENTKNKYINFLNEEIKLEIGNEELSNTNNEFTLYFPFLDRSNDYITIYIYLTKENNINYYYLNDNSDIFNKFNFLYSKNYKIIKKFKNKIKKQIKYNKLNLDHFEETNGLHIKVTEDKLIETLQQFLSVLIILNNIKVQDLK